MRHSRQATMHIGWERRSHCCADERLSFGTPAVGGQVDHRGDSAQLLLPVLDLGTEQRLRIGLVTEHLTLPQGEVRVLHRQR